MIATTRSLTAEDLWRRPDDGMRHELVRGELRTVAPCGGEHGAVGTNLVVALGAYVKSRKLGTVLTGDVGFIIARDPDTVRAPDVAFVRRERIPASGIPTKFWPGAPDLAVEVVSPSDTLNEVEENVHEWLGAGAALVWVANPRRRTVTVYRSPTTAAVLTATILDAEQNLEGEDIVPGFRLPVAEIFA
jgi:Uma2 family endonuclease